MGFLMKFETHEEFLYCKVSGEYSFEHLCSVVRKVLAEAGQRGANKVLVDGLQMWGSPTMAERYGLSEFLAREMVEARIFPRLAFLGKEPLVDPNRFGEIVGTNRGVQMKTVEEMEDAVKWLGERGDRKG
jgi:hypothetical protein